MNEETHYQKHKNVILKWAKDYYENDQKILREQAKSKYKQLFEEEKNIKREYGRNRYHNVSEKKNKY